MYLHSWQPGQNSTWPAAPAPSPPPPGPAGAHQKGGSTQAPRRSLRANLTGIQSPLLRVPVHPLEVTEARGTAKLCLPEVHVAGEEEVPVPWPHATLQQCRDMALPVSAPFRSQLEDPAFLPVQPAHPQVDDRLLVFWCVGDILDGASDNEVTGADSKEDLSIAARTAGGGQHMQVQRPARTHQLILEASGPPADVLLGRGLHKQATLLQAEALHPASVTVSIPNQQFQFSSFFQINISPRGVPEGLDAHSQVSGG